jgi:hypothetical protein
LLSSDKEEQSDEEEEEDEEEYLYCPHTGEAWREAYLSKIDPTWEEDGGRAAWLKRPKGDQGESGGKRGTVGESETIDLASEVRLCPPFTPYYVCYCCRCLLCLLLLRLFDVVCDCLTLFAVVAVVCRWAGGC